MSIFIDKHTTVIVQGITGRDGSFHTRQMIEYGTRVVAGVTPGKGGQQFDDKIPIFNTVAEAAKETGANTSVIYVPPMYASDAIMEAADAGVTLIVAITEGVPVLDMTRVYPFVKERGARLLDDPFVEDGHLFPQGKRIQTHARLLFSFSENLGAHCTWKLTVST